MKLDKDYLTYEQNYETELEKLHEVGKENTVIILLSLLLNLFELH
jgi:hypothetical protein